DDVSGAATPRRTRGTRNGRSPATSSVTRRSPLAAKVGPASGPPGAPAILIDAAALPNSRHQRASPEARIVPPARAQHAPQRDHGVEDVDVTHIERGEPEAQHVRSPEVTDHPVLDQRLHDRVAFGVGVADLAPAPLGIEGRDESQPEPLTLLLHELSEQRP